MSQEKIRELDKKIWQMLWPILLMTLVQKFGNLFEGVLVSVNSTEELTVTSICSPYITLITTISYGLGIAVNSMTGQLDGKGLWQKCWKNATKTMLMLLTVCGAMMSLISLVLLVLAFRSVPELSGLGIRYMMPYLLGSPILLLFQVLISAIRGLKNSKAGMKMILLSVPIQLIVGWLCYKIFGLGALGLGSLISRVAGCVLGMKYYKQHLNEASGNESLPKGFAKEFLELAIPVSLSKMVTPIAKTSINGLLLTIGSVYVGASGLAGSMEAFFYMPAMAMSSVAITLVAQEKAEDSVWSLCKRLCLWSVVPTVVMIVIAKMFDYTIWSLITPDAMLRDAGVEYWRICLWAYVMIALELAFTGILQAKGCGLPSLVMFIVRQVCVQLPITFLAVQLEWGAKGAWYGFLISNACSLLISFIWVWLKIKGENKNERN